MTDNKRQAHCKVLKMILNGTKPEENGSLEYA
jgi:hypothetical protein